MRILLGLVSALMIQIAAAEEVVRLSEPVEVRDGYEIFGAAMDDLDPGLNLSELIARRDQLAGSPVRLTTEITQVCQKKGCFFVARDGGTIARVKFADYGFFIPTDSSGKTVVLDGVLEQVELSPEQQAHYAADAGEPAPSGDAEPILEYTITATAVAIPVS